MAQALAGGLGGAATRGGAAGASPVGQAVATVRGQTAGVARECLTTLTKVIDNILTHPMEEKYRKIKRSNAGFRRKVCSVHERRKEHGNTLNICDTGICCRVRLCYSPESHIYAGLPPPPPPPVCLSCRTGRCNDQCTRWEEYLEEKRACEPSASSKPTATREAGFYNPAPPLGTCSRQAASRYRAPWRPSPSLAPRQPKAGQVVPVRPRDLRQALENFPHPALFQEGLEEPEGWGVGWAQDLEAGCRTWPRYSG